MTNFYLIKSPRLWQTQSTSDRRVTWLELFFDLIFVAAIAQVGVRLNADYSPAGLFRFVFLFVLIWWAWTGHTLYSTRFDSDDLIQRILTFIQIFTVAAMAANAKDALDSRSSAGFGAAYAGMRCILVCQYLRARKLRSSRELTTHYAIGFGIAAALWLISALLPTPYRYWIWALALIVDMGTPLLKLNNGAKLPPDAAHLPERFGLFTIILLGESVAAVMRGMESQEYWSPPAAASALLGLGLTFSIWWWYFDGAHGAGERHVKTKRQLKLFHFWTYSHLPLYVSIAVVAVGAEHIIALTPGTYLTGSEGWIISISVFVLMTSLAAISGTTDSAQEEDFKSGIVTKYLLASVALGVGIAASRIPPVFVLLALTTLCGLQVALAIRHTFAFRETEVLEMTEAPGFGD